MRKLEVIIYIMPYMNASIGIVGMLLLCQNKDLPFTKIHLKIGRLQLETQLLSVSTGLLFIWLAWQICAASILLSQLLLCIILTWWWLQVLFSLSLPFPGAAAPAWFVLPPDTVSDTRTQLSLDSCLSSY